MKEELMPGAGGWALYRDRDLPLGVHARFRPDSKGRLRLAALLIRGRGRIDAVTLRKLKPGLLEGLANMPAYKAALMDRIDEELEVSFEFREKRVRRPARHFPKIPERTPYPREFYEKIANLYGDMSAREIAEHYGGDVDEGRVYGWIQSARERGLLEGE